MWASVSIPGGFSWSLRQSVGPLFGRTPDEFQSLAGFLGRCDVGSSGEGEGWYVNVSIPGGFSWSLRLQSRKGGGLR